MDSYYFFIYLVYGLVFIAMGIYASGKKEESVIHIPLVKSLKYLGAFGVTHGLSEWITMVVITDLYAGQYVYLFYFKQFLKAVSFTFLLYFGLSLLFQKEKYCRFVRMLPVLILVIGGTGMIVLIVQYGWNYHIEHPQYNSVLLRYFMGLPGGVIAAWALYRQAMMMDNKRLYDIQVKYKRLAMIFLFYGLVDGLIVRELDFFPANVINNTLFIEWFGFPVQILKILIGIGIVYVLVQVINTFEWEQKEKMKKLEQQKIAYEERKKLGLEVHDSIIQSMYASTLKLRFLLRKNENRSEQVTNTLQEVITDLGDAISKTREFISESTMEQVELSELQNRIRSMVEDYNSNSGVSIVVSLDDHDFIPTGELTTEETTQIYYIVQEAVNNSIKHSKGTFTKVTLKSKANALHIKIIDDGVGFSLNKVNPKINFGIKSMRERAEQIGGTLNIRNRKLGTEVELVILWR